MGCSGNHTRLENLWPKSKRTKCVARGGIERHSTLKRKEKNINSKRSSARVRRKVPACCLYDRHIAVNVE